MLHLACCAFKKFLRIERCTIGKCFEWLGGCRRAAHEAARAQPAKTTLFGGGNGADVRKTAAGQFFQFD
jgi:hypothetical protein